MPFLRLATVAMIGGLTLTAGVAPASQSTAETVEGNDNRRPAGILADSVLTVQIYAARGAWRPERDEGPALNVAAFGEEGGPLVTPGPLLRASEGTDVIVRVRNTLAERLSIHGLVTRPAVEDAVFTVEPGQTREIRFAAGAPGTYHYWATTAGSALNRRRAVESQLGGAFIVDPRGSGPTDRVLVMTEWDDSELLVDEVVDARTRRVFAINGRSWPHTERLDEQVGRPANWRIVNLTQVSHPMHLHGFYFSVRGIGTGLRQTTYAPEEYRTVVTEAVPAGRTVQLVWTPERPGNWLLHCHMIAHATPALRFWAPAAQDHAHATHASHDAMTGMAGLVMGIRVSGRNQEAVTAVAAPARQLTLAMHRRPGHWRPEDAYGFALASGTSAPGPEDVSIPGPVLILTRREPVEIALKNELPEATAIHWHGIELDSYYDGVPGWGGNGVSTTPAIEPGGRFVVRFTPPRAGTFIYHTHSHDLRQLASGLYGAIVVVDPAQAFDATRDHVVVLGMEGNKDTLRYDRFPVVVNGRRDTVLTMKAGVPNRLRLINITTSFNGLNVSFVANNQPIAWRLVAKDGADLPPSQQAVRPALRQTIAVGETFDFVIDPLPSTASPQAPTGWIEVRRGLGEWVQQVPVRVVP
jgi:FtsP/CotA-like multicopper oxidase with cupredoxin domain